MDQYTADAIEANRNWRRAFHNVFVKQMGISEGALLNLKISGGYNQEAKEVIGVVTAVNWDELSLFCASPDTGSRYCYRDDAYKQYLNVTVQIGSETQVMKLTDAGIDYLVPKTNTKKNLVKYAQGRHNWNAPFFVSVLSPSETLLGDEWIEEGHAKAMAFLTKKRSKAKLDEADVTKLIKKWL